MVNQYANSSTADILEEMANVEASIRSLSTEDQADPARRANMERNLKFLENLLSDKLAEETRQYQEDMKFLDKSQVGTPPQDLANPPVTGNQFLQNSFSDPPLPPSGFSPYSGYDHITGGHFPSDSAIDRLDSNGVVPALWNMSTPTMQSTGEAQMGSLSQGSMGLSPGSASASSSDQRASFPSTPMQVNSINPRKRPRESLNLSSPTNARVAKALRATPSPAETLPTTPSSVDSFDFPDNPEFSRLLGGNPKEDMREMRKEQKAQEKMLRERLEQERRDEAFARQLMQEEVNSAAPQATSSWNDQSVFPRATTQTMIDDHGGLRRPQPSPWLPSPAAATEQNPTQTPRWTTPQDTLGRRSSTQPSFKFGNSQSRSNPSTFNVDDFIDLGSGDEFEDPSGDAGSDLMEISPATQNVRTGDKNPQRNLPWMDNSARGGNFRSYTPTAVGQRLPPENISANNNLSYLYNYPYQQLVGYGGTNVYNAPANNASAGSSSWADYLGRAGESVSNVAKGVYNAAYNLLDADIARVPTATPGFGSSAYGFGTAGSSSNPYLIPDVDFEDFSRPSSGLFNSVLNTHSINANDPKNRELVDRYKDRYDYLTNDPTKTSSEIKSLLENIRPDEELPPENREGTPDAMKYPLLEHQKLGLAWMKSMEEGSARGGILADDMGLGKTIQALALMVSRRSSDPRRKTTLIVAPVALMKQWEREIQQKLKPGRDHRLTTYILHGTNRQAPWEHLRTFDVVLTTFGTLANEIKRKEGIDMQKRVNPNWRPISKTDQLPLLGDECKWYRVIIDEAQCIKNQRTKAAQGAAELQSLTRFCMTGTPMMNNVTELYSLIHFLRIKPYNVFENFNRDFSRALKSYSPDQKDRAMQKFQALLKAILLRRTKKSRIDGKPILELPPRATSQEHAVFSEDEEAVYRALETQTQLQFNRYLKAGSIGRNYSNVLVLLLRLRQACCHPHLIKDFGLSSGPINVSLADMIALAKDLSADVVTRIKEQGRLNDQGALECPVCIDMAENATIFIPCGHSTCSECFARISDPSQAIVSGDAAEGRNFDIKCPNCRGKVNPSKVIDHNTFKKVHMPEEAGIDGSGSEAGEETTDESDSGSDDDSDGDVDDDDDKSVGSLRDFVVEDDVISYEGGSEHEVAKDTPQLEAIGGVKGETLSDEAKDKISTKEKSQKKKDKGKKKKKGKGKKKASLKTLAQLKKESSGSSHARRKYLERLADDWETSGKIEKVIEILQATRERNEGEKTIVFSQFTSLLDLLEVPIFRNGWDYKRYDGSMTSNARNEAVIEFSDKPNCTIMLVSLKAGNAGLNLVAASQVIIFDPFWNPYIEEQAIDRAHRIGQMRPVQVHKILVPNTVEDRIVKLQEKKRSLIEGALDETASQNIGRLGERELAFLFVSLGEEKKGEEVFEID